MQTPTPTSISTQTPTTTPTPSPTPTPTTILTPPLNQHPPHIKPNTNSEPTSTQTSTPTTAPTTNPTTNPTSTTTTPNATAPFISIMIYPKNPQTDTQVFFTITANDNGNENVNINLYIDGQTAETSTGHGVHTYQGGPYSPGTHTYLVTATDQANNKASDPTSGYYVFVITDPNAKTTSESTTSLWIVLAVFASLSAITLTFTALRKNKKTPATTQPNQ